MDVYFLIKMFLILSGLAVFLILCLIALRRVDYQERLEEAHNHGDPNQINQKSLGQIVGETLANAGKFGTGIGYVVGAFFLAQFIVPALPPALRVDEIGATMLIILFPILVYLCIKALINNV